MARASGSARTGSTEASAPSALLRRDGMRSPEAATSASTSTAAGPSARKRSAETGRSMAPSSASAWARVSASDAPVARRRAAERSARAACTGGSYRTAGLARTMLACWAEMVPVESVVSTSQNMRLSPPPQGLSGSMRCFEQSALSTS